MKTKTNKSSKLRDFICLICKKPFQNYLAPSDIKKGAGNTCSKECQRVRISNVQRRGKVVCCTECNQEKLKSPSVIKRSAKIYICKKCRRRPQKISLDGYFVTWIKGRKNIKVHRLVMEKRLGRRLLSSEIVHHIDHDKFNNRLENLQIVTRSEHNKIHGFLPNTGEDQDQG